VWQTGTQTMTGKNSLRPRVNARLVEAPRQVPGSSVAVLARAAALRGVTRTGSPRRRQSKTAIALYVLKSCERVVVMPARPRLFCSATSPTVPPLAAPALPGEMGVRRHVGSGGARGGAGCGAIRRQCQDRRRKARRCARRRAQQRCGGNQYQLSWR